MSEIALLYTLSNHADLLPIEISRSIDNDVKSIFDQYADFLRQLDSSDKTIQSFAAFDKAHGAVAATLIDATKHRFKAVKDDVNFKSVTDVRQLIARTLLKLYATNTHVELAFGPLTQALSGYLEIVSVAGCKSGNERTQHHFGRMKTLLSLEEGMHQHGFESLSENQQTLVHLLQGFNDPTQSVSAEMLRDALDRVYNSTIHGANSRIPTSDQAAPAKIGTTDIDNPGIDTSQCETKLLTNLQASNAKAVQPHKCKTLVKDTKTLAHQTLTSRHTQAHQTTYSDAPTATLFREVREQPPTTPSEEESNRFCNLQ